TGDDGFVKLVRHLVVEGAVQVRERHVDHDPGDRVQRRGLLLPLTRGRLLPGGAPVHRRSLCRRKVPQGRRLLSAHTSDLYQTPRTTIAAEVASGAFYAALRSASARSVDSQGRFSSGRPK